MTQHTLVLGGGPIGLRLATELVAGGHAVTYVDDDKMTKRARAVGVTAHESTLETAPRLAGPAATVVVSTASDARNLLLASVAPSRFDTDDVIALVNDPDNQPAFDDAGIDTICVATAISTATTNVVAPESLGAAEADTSPRERVGVRD